MQSFNTFYNNMADNIASISPAAVAGATAAVAVDLGLKVVASAALPTVMSTTGTIISGVGTIHSGTTAVVAAFAVAPVGSVVVVGGMLGGVVYSIFS